MMSVMEYAVDVDKTVEEVLKLCKKLDIKATNEEDMLSEDDIIMLDNELPIDEEQDEEIEEDSYEDEVVDDDELEKDLRIEIVHDEATQKMKKKPVSNKKDNKDYLKAKK